MGEAGEERVGAGRIDDDEVAAMLDRLDCRGKVGELAGLVVVEPDAVAERNAMMPRQFQRPSELLPQTRRRSKWRVKLCWRESRSMVATRRPAFSSATAM
jgi:hypothetical protein